MPRDPVSTVEGLSTALTQVLALVKTGKTNKEIADVRGVSEQAVKRQLSVLFRRFGVDTRAGLIGAVYEGELRALRQRAVELAHKPDSAARPPAEPDAGRTDDPTSPV